MKRKLSLVLPTTTIVAVMVTLGLTWAIHNTRARDPDNRLAISRGNAGSTRTPVRPKSAKWKEKDLGVDDAIEALMAVFRDSTQPDDERHRALLTLAMLRGSLEDKGCLDELAASFDGAIKLHKSAILSCFIASEDRRGLVLYTNVLDKEADAKLRLSAASGLSQWNIRRGVRELVELLGSEEVLTPPVGRIPLVRENALESLLKRNKAKDWGFAEDAFRNAQNARGETSSAELVELQIREFRRWFSEHEDRFPSWKSGDPLPEVERKDAASKEDSAP